MISICAERFVHSQSLFLHLRILNFQEFFLDRDKSQERNISTKEMGRNKQRVINRFEFITNRHSKTIHQI